MRSPRAWLYAAGGWLIVCGLFHVAMHVWSFVLENELIGLRDFASDAMKQAISFGPLRPSLWHEFNLYSISFAMLLVFAGVVDMGVAALRAEPRLVRATGLLGTVFWTAAFVPFAFFYPVLTAIVAAGVAVPLHALVYTTASLDLGSAPRPVGGDGA